MNPATYMALRIAAGNLTQSKARLAGALQSVDDAEMEAQIAALKERLDAIAAEVEALIARK